ncbi:Crp/Fnr family transcriptional regulator [Desulfosporosinus fructosivorans]|uniref:Crp/Fnr family transcriptional regulator n=1 Tax=Desulfosporosinus fructosivorans TaxID=2018669 RepID=A0A4Z0R2X4_9FIRM|nr:Crp/Fnr family transcriptional regulator [Desulfosporosinus fructosivorans]TGE36337.1 Crp/Fnr family transcriptional regulator [Desulfosporosinus fructosivorans]
MKRCIICLQQLDLFLGLAQEQLTNLCQCTQRKKLSRGHYLFRQGEARSTIYLIKSGKLKLVQTTEAGHETILDICGPGEVLGELSLYREQNEHCSAIAMEDVCICCFSKLQFEALIKQDPSFAMRIIGYLGQKRYETMVKLGKEAGLPVKERLLQLFYRLAEQYGKQTPTSTLIDLKITQQELADMIGSSRVMVIQALKEFKAANIIDREKRYFVLKDDPCISIHKFE